MFEAAKKIMKRSTGLLAGAGAVAVVGALGLLRMRSQQGAPSTTSEPTVSVGGPGANTTGAPNAATPTVTGNELRVGFLPVTCHLTCPVTDFATQTSKTNHFVSQRFTDFPTVSEAFKSKRLQATFIIAPLAMKMREQGVPVKIVYLGHRDGSTVMVAKNSPAKSLRDLRGKTFAIPSRFSNQNLVIRKLMDDQGVDPKSIKFVEMPPPDMPGALGSGAIDAYFVGEPMAAKAELDGTGRVLYHAKDIWPRFISCVLAVREDLIETRPDLVKDLVRGIADSGAWAETHRTQAATLAAPYYRQKEKLLRYVLTTPKNRVSYAMLTPTDKELQQIADMGLKTGVLTKRLDVRTLVDRTFIPQKIVPAAITDAQISAAKNKVPAPS